MSDSSPPPSFPAQRKLTVPSKARIYNAALKLWEAWGGVDLTQVNLSPALKAPMIALFDLFEPGDEPDLEFARDEKTYISELANLVARLSIVVFDSCPTRDRSGAYEIRIAADKIAGRFR